MSRRSVQPRRVQPRTQDPVREKRAGTALCPGCGARYHAGRWSWEQPAGGEAEELCEACRRIRDGTPVGVVRVARELELERDDLERLARNVEEQERSEHPLERLMSVEDQNGGLEVATTGLHLARCIASALRRRFKDRARIDYADERGLIRLFPRE